MEYIQPIYRVSDTAYALYDGGWSFDDHDRLMEEYSYTSEEQMTSATSLK